MEKSKIWYLENFNLFKGLTMEQLQYFGMKSSMRKFKKGEFIYFPNELSDKVFILKDGEIKIGMYTDDGREILKTVLRSGEIFGEMSLTGEIKRGDFAQANDNEVVICVFDVDVVEEMIRQNPNLSLKITKIIGFRLKTVENKLASLVFKDARSRIVDFLKEQADKYGKPVGYETLIMNNLTHKDIASLTATSRQTVTTVLNDLRSKNLIYFDRRRILIRDMDKLV